jgi:hypothetical protein
LKKYIIFRGGLGNQVFQYAAASAAFFNSMENGELFFTNSPVALLEGKMKIKNLQIKNVKISSNLIINYFFVPLILRYPFLFTWKFPLTNFSILSIERNLSFDSNIFKRNAFFYLGYFQSEKYFLKHRKRIVDNLRSLNSKSGEVKSFEHLIRSFSVSAALHVRRGDYISNENANKIHGFSGLEYYLRSIKFLKKNHTGIKFFIFSDDIRWCKNYFTGSNFIFIESAKLIDADEIYLMSICNHNIISNSSFSWWGGWLNENKKKTVIAPKKWFSDDSIEKHAGDIVPEEWLRL